MASIVTGITLRGFRTVNDGQQTAPPKRILAVLPDYQKPVAGLPIAEHIGLTAFRTVYPNFDAWMTNLLGLAYSP